MIIVIPADWNTTKALVQISSINGTELACMPADIYGTLYPFHVLAVATPLVKNIYAKKPEPGATTGTTPFSMYHMLKTKLQYSKGGNPRVTLYEAYLFDNAMDKVS